MARYYYTLGLGAISWNTLGVEIEPTRALSSTKVVKYGVVCFDICEAMWFGLLLESLNCPQCGFGYYLITLVVLNGQVCGLLCQQKFFCLLL